MSYTVLDKLNELFPESSKQSLLKWIKQGRVQVNDKTVKRKDLLIQKEDSVSLLKRKNFDLPFEILYSDSYIVVVDKPAGMLSVASLDPAERNVHKYLKNFLKSEKVAPLHRLDKEVAGPLIFVKNQKSFDLFKNLFLSRSITREYRALVMGSINQDFGTFESYLKEKEGYKVYSCDSYEGKKAITHFEVIEKNPDYSYLKIKLETGRKNQIRVHLSDAKHPIVGDKKYGFSHPQFKGLALYAHKLSFIHPITKKEMVFESKPPFNFRRLLQIARFKI